MTAALSSPTRGRIEVICGCMFAGKTALLIERLSEARAAGRRVRAFKHSLDTRYDVTRLATHDGRTFEAIPAADADAILRSRGDAEVIGIDEAQFFGRGLVAACQALHEAGVRVVLAGIHNDAWGRPFPPFPQLEPLQASRDVLRAACRACGAPGEFSQRMAPVTDEFMVGGVGDYEPRCAACFEPLPEPPPAY